MEMDLGIAQAPRGIALLRWREGADYADALSPQMTAMS